MAIRRTMKEPTPETVETVETVVSPSAPVETPAAKPEKDCGCKKNAKGQIELKHSKISAHIWVNPESVDTWKQQGWNKA